MNIIDRILEAVRPRLAPVRGAVILPSVDVGKGGSRVRWRGLLQVEPSELRQNLRNGWASECVEGWNLFADPEVGTVLCLPKPNLVVDSGVQRGLDLVANINSITLISQKMGVDDGASNPVAATSSSSAGSTNRRIINLDSTATRSTNVLSSVGTFTQANVAFIMKRLFLTKAAAGTTDAAGDLFAMTNVFTMDLTAFSTWSQTFTAQVTGTGS